jgi:uridylate kinase
MKYWSTYRQVIFMALAWKRVILKLSGEALQGKQTHGLDQDTLHRIASDVAEAASLGAEIGIVVGGGNFFRGIQGADKGIDRARADSIGMLATIMNGLAVEHAIETVGQPARALSAVPVPYVCQPYSRQAALNHLGKGRVIVLAGGTGNPFFTTDTGAALRAAELSANLVMKATQVDGVYSADPKKDPNAVRYDTLTHGEAIEKNLGVMDTAAFALARENAIPIIVFSLSGERPITQALKGEGNFTLVTP